MAQLNTAAAAAAQVAGDLVSLAKLGEPVGWLCGFILHSWRKLYLAAESRV